MNDKTKYQPKNTPADLNGKIKKFATELSEATSSAAAGEAVTRYLGFLAKFHSYSAHNCLLIWFANPDATMVAGYHRWIELGRFVRKGESGIPILAPVIVKDDDGDDKCVGFKVVYVFDISQTDGNPLPEQPEWKSGKQDSELAARLVKFAESKGVKIKFDELTGDVQGASSGGKIVISKSAGTKTIVHEIAHELLHYKEREEGMSSVDVELEAETVGYVVCRHFGVEGLNSANYLALHGADPGDIIARFERIRKAAAEIINGVEKSG